MIRTGGVLTGRQAMTWPVAGRPLLHRNTRCVSEIVGDFSSAAPPGCTSTFHARPAETWWLLWLARLWAQLETGSLVRDELRQVFHSTKKGIGNDFQMVDRSAMK